MKVVKRLSNQTHDKTALNSNMEEWTMDDLKRKYTRLEKYVFKLCKEFKSAIECVETQAMFNEGDCQSVSEALVELQNILRFDYVDRNELMEILYELNKDSEESL